MELIKYTLLVSISLTLLYGIYLLLLKNDTFLKMKRFYLLFVIFFSLLYPFCQINLNEITLVFNEYWLPIVEVNPNIQNEIESTHNVFNYQTVLFYIMIFGTIFLLFKFIIQLIGIFRIKLRCKTIKIEQYEIICIDDKNISPFSFFNWIFVNPMSYNPTDLEGIIIHERIHTNQLHSIDILIAEFFSFFFWWNPFAWLLKKEIKINLEYLADEGVLAKGYNSKQYQYLLLQASNPNIKVEIVNNFNISQLKKCITVINKERTSKSRLKKYLFTLPVIALMILANANYSLAQSTNQDQHNDNIKPFTVVEQMPQYIGGDAEMMKFIGQNLIYPEDAIKNNTEGKLVVSFVVTSTGKITDVVVTRSLSPSCDAEAVRVVESMPNWTPGKQNGVEVPVYFTLPIMYKMTKETTSK